MVKETILKDNVEKDNKNWAPAFKTKYLDEEKEDTENEILTLRFNPRNRENLDVIKWLLHEPKDATAIKYAIEWARKDIQAHLSEESWRKICSETRRKPNMKRPRTLSN